MQKQEMEAKKEYMAALSLSNKEVGEAVKAEQHDFRHVDRSVNEVLLA